MRHNNFFSFRAKTARTFCFWHFTLILWLFVELSTPNLQAGKTKYVSVTLEYNGSIACASDDDGMGNCVPVGSPNVTLQLDSTTESQSWDCPDECDPEVFQFQQGFIKKVRMRVGEWVPIFGFSQNMEPSIASITYPSCYEFTIDDGVDTYYGVDGSIGFPLWGGALAKIDVSGGVTINSSACCQAGNGFLTADGESKASATCADPNVSWGFDGPSLGCSISGSGNTAIITAGNQEGTVTVTATSIDGCVYEGSLTLVCKPDPSGPNGGGGGCQSCRQAYSAMEVMNDNGPNLSWSLGASSAEFSAGTLKLTQQSPGAVTPASLLAPELRLNIEKIYDQNGVLKQLKSLLGLIDVANVTSTSYELRFYAIANVGAYDISSSRYAVSGSPIVTYTIQNPGADINKVRITETRGSLVLTYDYTWDTVNHKWQLQDSDVTRTVVSWITNPSGTLTNHFLQIKSATTIVYSREEDYAFAGPNYVIQKSIIGDGSNTNITEYTYYPSSGNANANNNNRLKQKIESDNYWEIYDYDALGRVTTKYSPYGNQAPTTTATLCKMTLFGFNSVFGDDDDTVQPLTARQETVKIKNNEVSRTYRKFTTTTGEIQLEEQVCPNPALAWNDSSNIKTITVWNDGGSDDQRLKRVQNPDGTMSFYTYTPGVGTLTTTVTTGEPNVGKNATLNGTQTITVVGDTGETQSTITKPIVAGTIVNAPLSSETYTYTDDLNTSYSLLHLNQRTTVISGGCCGIDSETDIDGAVTVYAYDQWKRRTSATSVTFGSSVQQILDPIGNLLVRKRVSGANTIVDAQFAYDTAGRQVKQTNALLGVTTTGYDLSLGYKKMTITNPDTGTRIEKSFKDQRLDSLTGTAVYPVHYVYDVEQDGGIYREYRKEIKLDDSYVDTSEWTKTYIDGAGREYKTIYAAASGTPYRQLTFNNKNQLTKVQDPDGLITLYDYNGKGERVRTVADLNQNGVINITDGNPLLDDDRITDILNDSLANGASGNSRGTDINRTLRYVFTTNDSMPTNLISKVETSMDGLKTWTTRWRDGSTSVTSSTQIVYGGSGARTETTTNPDGSSIERAYSYGRLSTEKRKEAGGGQVTLVVYDYDAFGRLASSTDARNGPTSLSYNAADQVLTSTFPSLLNGEPSQVTRTYYDSSLRINGQLLPDNTTTTNFYFVRGLLQKTYGSRIYPVEYTYDPQGRMKTMKTWRNFAGGAETAITTWNYDQYRGFLSSKYYPNATTGAAGTSGLSYTYKASGRLLTRVWERAITTTYAYNNAGDLYTVSYSDGTPITTFSYDRRGRRLTAARNSITTSFTFNEADLPLTETYGGGTLAGLSVNYGYNTYLQNTSAQIKNGSTDLQTATYSYDTAGRLQTVTDGSVTAYTATYAYTANSLLINTVTFKNTGSTRLLTTKNYDRLNRPVSITSQAYNSSGVAVGSPVGAAYQYNSADQRTRTDFPDGSYWVYQYDSLGQVVSGKRFWPDGTIVDGQQFDYTLDDIGNRRSSGGRVSSISAYTRDYQNKYTQRTVAGTVDVMGIANPTASVTVNGNTSNRKGEYYHWPLAVANSTGQYPTVTVVSTYGATQTSSGAVFVPPSTETYGYDADGNLTSDGRWTYIWDGENRLIEMKRDASTPTLSSRLRLVFEYDWQGRRIRKTFYTHNGTSWVLSTDRAFLYDRWNLVGELNSASSNAKLRTYIWGTDLSGSPQGAGGVGGLLKITDFTSGTTHHFVSYDGNGNVIGLSDGSGTSTARYEYGPFGEILRTTGSETKNNPFRFSTKFQDNESGLTYYGYRYYSSYTGRWLNRDRIGESGGFNQYGLLNGDPLNNTDVLGLDKNIVFTATCDLCMGGPKFGTASQTLVREEFHTWSEGFWTGNHIQPGIPGVGPVTGAITLPGNGNKEQIGGPVTVNATCLTPINNYALIAFFVTDWGQISDGPNMKPTVSCLYSCNNNVKIIKPAPGQGSFPKQSKRKAL
jgi:RHS repeat-associated protein